MLHSISKGGNCFDYHYQENFERERLLSKNLLTKIQLQHANEEEVKYFINVLVHLEVIATC